MHDTITRPAGWALAWPTGSHPHHWAEGDLRSACGLWNRGLLEGVDERIRATPGNRIMDFDCLLCSDAVFFAPEVKA
jgi:hypothetical protein